jgi:hypothetical protein
MSDIDPHPGVIHLPGLDDRLDVGQVAELLDRAFCVVVAVADARCRRHLYLTLASAERSARRARVAGYEVAVVLCQLVPTGVVANDRRWSA